MKIDKEFSRLIPPITKEEKDILEQSIINERMQRRFSGME